MGAYEVLVFVLAVVAISSQSEAKGICAGCPVQQDPSSFPVEKLAHALATANVDEGVARIISVTSQVVAGVRYTVVYESASGKTCEATWIEASWESKAPLAPHVSCRAKRSLVGGYVDVKDSDLPVMKGLGEFAANQQQNGNRKVVLKVLKAQQKIVNGVMYKVKFVVKTTACSMEQVPNESCLNNEVAPRQVCEALLYSSPLLVHDAPHLDVMHTECQNADADVTSFLSIPGGIHEAEENDEELHDAALFAADEVNAKMNSLYLKGLYKIKNAREQVVAGSMYYLTIVMRDTECRRENGVQVSSKDCPFVAQPQSADLECEVAVWTKSWTGFRKVVSSKCHSL